MVICPGKCWGISTASQARLGIMYYKLHVLKMFMKQKLWQCLKPNSSIERDLRASHSPREHASRLPSSCMLVHSLFIQSYHSEVYLPLPLCTDDVYSNMCGYVLLCCYGAITEMLFISRTAQHHYGLPVRRVIFQ